MKPLFILTICPIMALAACADLGATCTPILDGAKGAAYQKDLQACQSLVRDQRRLDQDTIGSAAAGGLLGAAVAAHDDGATALEGLAGSALVGLVGRVAKASDKRKAIVVACMQGRGHRVVG